MVRGNQNIMSGYEMKVEENRTRRPKPRWLDTIENDIRAVGVSVVYEENREKLGFRTKEANFKWL